MNKFGFRIIEQIDIGRSILGYQRDAISYEASQCFNNAFRFLGNNITNKTCKAVFGYVLSTDGIRKVAVRHAWNLEDNYIVDVTMIANSEHPISMLNYYYLPIEIYDAQTFLRKIEENNNFPCLPKTKKELDYIQKLKNKGFEVLE